MVAPAWTSFMGDVYDGRPAAADWTRPDSLVPREVDDSTGYLATPFCPQKLHRWEWFYPSTEPTQECPVHRVLGPALTPSARNRRCCASAPAGYLPSRRHRFRM